MQIVSEELSTLEAAMAIKDGKVADWNFGVQLQVLDALVAILHAFSLADITHHSRIKSLNLKLECPNSERIVWLQNKFLVLLQSPVNSARLQAVNARVLNYQRAQFWVVNELKVVFDDSLSLNSDVLTA